MIPKNRVTYFVTVPNEVSAILRLHFYKFIPDMPSNLSALRESWMSWNRFFADIEGALFDHE
jgi:hypothetical protein